MTYYLKTTLAVALAVFFASSVVAADKQAMIDDALSSAPDAISKNAKVMDWDGNVLQEGTNGFVCYPSPPMLDGTSPMCLDGVWVAWADAWMNKKPFTATSAGIAYMLAGDGGASNIDPFAEAETADNEWVVEGPHLMLIVPDAASLEGFPTDPENGGPYVMWKGTDYAHVMVPTTGK
jgi:hypothetical protein